jgi:hypothetical protein
VCWCLFVCISSPVRHGVTSIGQQQLCPAMAGAAAALVHGAVAVLPCQGCGITSAHRHHGAGYLLEFSAATLCIRTLSSPLDYPCMAVGVPLLCCNSILAEQQQYPCSSLRSIRGVPGRCIMFTQHPDSATDSTGSCCSCSMRQPGPGYDYAAKGLRHSCCASAKGILLHASFHT